MDPANYEYQSEFARRYFSEGKAEGKAEVIITLATMKFGPVSAAVQERIRTAAMTELELMAERVLSATTIEEMLG